MLTIAFASTSLSLVAQLGTTRAGWVDPDTRTEFLTTDPLTAGDQREYKLVFSDEFEQEGRTFGDGEDPRWTAINKNDYTNEALHYYSKENVRTTNGMLNITTERKDNKYKAFNEKTKKHYVDTKHVQSAMVQGWNKFCVTGGIIEFSAKLPGRSDTGGLWPALWLLGNLARATFVGSSDFVWPFSYNQCNDETRVSQEIDACSKVSHYGMEPGVGRGAPEIDVLEAMGGEAGKIPNTPIQRPYFSTSLQIAPGLKNDRPILGKQPFKGHWYEGLEYGNATKAALNPFFYGVTLVHKPKSYTYQSDALSANMHISEHFYQHQHKYRVEWEPPNEDGTGGYVKWYCDGKFIYGIAGDSLKLTGTKIPDEPMYLLINTAVASSWGFPKPCPPGCDCECFECGNPDCICGLPAGYCDNFPAFFEVDYVRVYQAVNESKHELGCSTERRPTDLFIKGHQKRYTAKGDKRPLLPVQNGGASCENDADCGGAQKGECSHHGSCLCNQNFTGPRCLAHFGLYDFESSTKGTEFDLDAMILPKGMLLMVCVLVLGFLVSMLRSILGKRKEGTKYAHEGALNGSSSYDNEMAEQVPLGVASYQKAVPHPPVSSQPQQQKVVTYCVIDGRLIDE